LKIKFDTNIMQFMNVFSTITNVDLKDCLVDSNDLLTFIVKENELGRAVGKRGFKAKMIERAVNRKIKILEFNPDVASFVRNLVYPLQLRSVEMTDEAVVLEPVDSRTRGMLIGRGAQNLRNYENIIKRYFSIEELRVL